MLSLALNIDVETSSLAVAPTDFLAIGIQAYGGSGSLFMQSLLDGHPDILALPGTLGIQYYNSWAIHLRNTPATEIGYETIKSFIRKFFAIIYDASAGEFLGLNELGEDMKDSSVVDQRKFEAAFDFLVDRMIRESGIEGTDLISSVNVQKYRTICLKAVYLAYAFCIDQDITRKKFLLYSAHGGPLNDIEALCQDFKEVRFVHMVREPIQNLDSVQRRLVEEVKTTRPDVDAFWCVINHLYNDRAPQAPICGVPMYSVYPYPMAAPGHSIAVRLEDLHREPRKTLSALAQWLGLEWSETLMQSTFAGKKWWNLPGLRRISGFSTSMTGRPPQFGKFDQWRLREIGAPIGMQYAYPGYRRNIVEEWTALLLSLLPFSLECKTYSFRHLLYFVTRRMPWNEPPKNEVWNNPKQYDFSLTALVVTIIATPSFVLWDYCKHRTAIWQGFMLNRRSKTTFVPLLDLGVASNLAKSPSS